MPLSSSADGTAATFAAVRLWIEWKHADVQVGDQWTRHSFTTQLPAKATMATVQVELRD